MVVNGGAVTPWCDGPVGGGAVLTPGKLATQGRRRAGISPVRLSGPSWPLLCLSAESATMPCNLQPAMLHGHLSRPGESPGEHPHQRSTAATMHSLLGDQSKCMRRKCRLDQWTHGAGPMEVLLELQIGQPIVPYASVHGHGL